MRNARHDKTQALTKIIVAFTTMASLNPSPVAATPLHAAMPQTSSATASIDAQHGSTTDSDKKNRNQTTQSKAAASKDTKAGSEAEANALLVTMDMNGGSGSIPDVSVTPFGGTPVVLEKPENKSHVASLPKRVGFTFIGWSTKRRMSPDEPLDRQGKETFIPANTPLTDGEYRYVDIDGDSDSPYARKFVGGQSIELVGDALAPGSRDSQGRRIKSASLFHDDGNDGRIVLYAVWEPDASTRVPEAEMSNTPAHLVGELCATVYGTPIMIAGRASVAGMRLLPKTMVNRTYLRAPTDADVQVAVTRNKKEDVVAAVIGGIDDSLLDASEQQMLVEDTLIKAGGLSVDEAKDVSVKMSTTLRTASIESADDESADDTLVRSLDGSNVESLDLWWVTEDSPNPIDDGADDILYRKPAGDTDQSVKMKLNYALSGEFDYDEGDIKIYLPVKMFSYRDGTDAGELVIPYPQAPSRAQDFNWERIGDYYVLTNTKRMSAATKGFMELAWRKLTPHKLVDMADSLQYKARIEVTTHRGNTIGLISDPLIARFDTEQQVTDDWKQYVSHEWVAASEIPERQRVSGETEYLVVTWQTWAKHNGNTEFTLKAKDVPTDEYHGKVIDEGMATDGTMTYENIATGWRSDGEIGYETIRVAYPGSQFNPDTDYLLTNEITYTLTEADPECHGDPQKVTEVTATASLPFRWHRPVFEDPQGHFMMNKIGNDGAAGKDSSPYWSRSTGYNNRGYYKGLDVNNALKFFHNTDDGYGIYPSALNDLQDGQPVELSYTVESEGYLLPWTIDGPPALASSYGRKPVTMTTYDTDETQEKQVYLSDGTALEVGTDYEYVSVEFPLIPDIGLHVASNLNPDGTFVATHAGDGTFIYGKDPNTTNIPPIFLEAKIGDTWVSLATVNWSSGTCVITPNADSGAMPQGQKVLLPPGVTQVRTQVVSTNAYIWYYFRPTIRLKASGQMATKTQQLFANSFVPSLLVYNTGSMYAYDSTGAGIAEFHKNAYDELQGYTADVAIYPSKTGEQLGESYENREVTIHYEAEVQERTFMKSVATYEQAVADGRLVPDTKGVFYDLLPKGVVPDIHSVRLRSGDSITDIRTIENYKGTGRVLLVVKADLQPQLTTYAYDGAYDRRVMDVPRIEFDATYNYDSIRDYGDVIHNVIAYESLARDDLGTVDGYMGEYDDPTGNRNIATQTAFANDGDIQALTGVDTSHASPSFAYAGAVTTIDMLGAAQTSLSKKIMVNNDGRWSQGTYEDKRTVYEGGVYSYELNMTSEAQTISKGLILYDSLENFYAADGNDDADIGAPRWRGTLMSVDVSPLTERGIAPVVYYSTVDNLLLSDETHSDEAHATNTRLDNTNIWIPADDYQGSMSAVHAVAIDARHNADGTDFILQPEDTVTVFLNMLAPSGEAARTYISQKGIWGDSAHAYNNVYLLCDSIDANDPEIHDADNFVRHDYTKVGLMEHSYTITKVWDDNDDQDGRRPQSVTLHLLADDVDTGMSATVGEQDGWTAKFEHIPYTDGTGRKIQYSVTEDPVPGYKLSIVRDGTNVTVTNTHRPETTSISGKKSWTGDEDYPEARPTSIKIALLADGTVIQTKRVVPDESGRWLYEFTDLPKYRDHGVEIAYTIEEQVDYYSSYIFQTESGYDIRNTYHPYGDLEIDKTVLHATEQFANREFDVIVTLTDGNGVPLSGTYEWSSTDGTSGTIQTGGTLCVHDGSKVTIHDIPEYSLYRIEEVEAAGYAARISGATGTVHPNVTAAVYVTNTYSATGFINLMASKTLTGRDMSRYQFRFQLLDSNGNIVRTASNMENGTVTYGALNYTEADAGKTFTYVMREVDRGRPGYAYDSATFVAKVTVTDNGNGTLSCSVRYETADGTQIESPDVPAFANSYEAHGSIQLRAWKQLTGGELENGQFSFQLLSEDGTVLQTKTNDADGNIMFDPIAYDQEDAGKKYKYVVKEVAGNDSAIIYDDNAYGYEVTVADNGDGTLLCTTGYVEVDKHRMTWSEMDADERQYHAWLFIQDNVWQNPCLYDPDFEFVGSNEIKDIINMTAEEHSIKSHYGLYTGIGPSYSSTSSTSAFPLSSLDTYPVPCFILNDAGVAYVRDYLPTWTVKFDSASKYMFFAREGYFDLCSPLITDGVATAVLLEDINVYIPTSTAVDTAPVFRNSYKPGNLAISKSTSDDTPAEHEDDEFRFKVKLTGPELPNEITYDLEQHPKKTRVRISAVDKDTQQTVTGATFTGAGTWDADEIDPNNPPVVQVAMTQTPEGYAPTGRVHDVTNDVWYETPFDLTVTGSCELEYEVVPVVRTSSSAGCSFGIQADGTMYIYPTNGISANLQDNMIRYGSNDIKSITAVYGEKGIRVPSADHLFWGGENIVKIDFSKVDSSECADVDYMFFSCSKLADLNLGNFDASHCTQLTNMFSGCSSLTSLDLSHWDTRNITIMSSMFSWCSNLVSVNLTNWNTENVTNMGYMFSSCPALETLDLSSFKTPSLTYMQCMFNMNGSRDPSHIKTINLSNLDASHTAVANDFRDQSYFDSLETIVLGEGNPFLLNGSCANIVLTPGTWSNGTLTYTATELVAHYDPTNENMRGTWTRQDISGGGGIAANIVSLVSASLSTWDGFEKTKETVKPICDFISGLWKPTVAYAVTDGWTLSGTCEWKLHDDGQLVIRPIDNGTEGIMEDWGYRTPWNQYASSIISVTVQPGVKARTCADMFYSCSNLQSADLSNLDTSAVSNMEYMFGHCSQIVTLDLSDWDTSNVTNMAHMFDSCTSLESINMAHWSTPNLTQARSMFATCSSLKRLDVSMLDVSHVQVLHYMFGQCYALEWIDLSNFNPASAVTTYSLLFSDSKLQTIVLGEYNPFISQGEGVWTEHPGPSFRNATVPTPPSSTTTGKWVNLKDPENALTPYQLATEYDGSNSVMQGEWIWEVPSTTFRFEANGGIGRMDDFRIAANETGTLPAMNFIFFDHDFVCWNTSPDGTGTQYSNAASYTAPVSSTQLITLYAQWQQRNHHITLENGEFYVTIPANATLTLPNLPAGTSYQIYEETAAGWTLVSSSDTAGMIVPTETVTAAFTNRYNPNETSIQLAGNKTLDGDPVAANAFSFVLKEGDTVIATVPTQNGGGFTFAPIVYTSAGNHTYTITEVDSGNNTINYDTHTETIHVAVTDTDGVLSASTTYDNDGITFANTTKPGNLTILKNVTGQTNANRNDAFEVSVRLSDTFGEPLQRASVSIGDNPSIERTETTGIFAVQLKGGEQATFSELPAGTVYSVTETNIPAGWSLSASNNVDGTIAPTVTSAASLTNAYSAKGEVTLQAWKSLNGRSPKADEFTFELVDEDATGKPVIDTATNEVIDTRTTVAAEDGVTEIPNPHLNQAPVAFDAISYTEEGTHHYSIREVAGNDASIVYDATVVGVTVTVTDAGHGNLHCEVAYDDNDWLFENEVQTGSLSVMKTATGVTPASATETFDFTVTLADQDGEPLPNGSFPLSKSRIPADASQVPEETTCSVVDGAVSLSLSSGEVATIGGLPVGTSYSVAETGKGAWHISSSSGETGTIGAAAGTSTMGAAAMFDNEYRTAGTFSISGTKEFVGQNLEAGQFEFMLKDGNDAFVARVSNESDGTFSFDNIILEPGDVGKTLTYYVSEVPGDIAHIVYDSHIETVTVLVSDDGQGHLSATVTYDDDGCKFVNSYALEMPTTGQGGMERISLLSVAAIVMACLTFLARKREIDNARIHRGKAPRA